MYYKIKNIEREKNELYCEYLERVRRFFNQYIKQKNYSLVNMQWINKNSCIIVYCVID